MSRAPRPLPWPQPGALEVPRLRDLRLETGVEPGRSLEDALLLARKDFPIGVNPVRNARGSSAGPLAAVAGAGLHWISGGSIGWRHAALTIGRGGRVCRDTIEPCRATEAKTYPSAGSQAVSAAARTGIVNRG